MPNNSNRWQRLAAELAEQAQAPHEGRTGRKWRAKLRAQREAETTAMGGSETQEAAQADGKPSPPP